MSVQDSSDWYDQQGFRLRFGWGPNGLRRLAPVADVVVIVDVLSFSTAVDVALGRGATVLPYRWHDGSEDAYAAANDAVVAVRKPEPGRLSLRPSSLVEIDPGTRLVLPSPNGSALAFAASEAGASRVIVGSLRNAAAVGAEVGAAVDVAAGTAVPPAAEPGVAAVIAAGERWRGATGPMRPAVEDLLGAGAILAAARSSLHQMEAGQTSHGQTDPGRARLESPEAAAAIAAFTEARPVIGERLTDCSSGRELIGRGFAADVELAAALDTSSIVPTLAGSELVDTSSSSTP